MYICENESEINYHKVEVHIVHPNNQYDHFKISSIIGHSNIVEFIQKLRKCRGLKYDNNLPKPCEIKEYDKAKENERKVKFLKFKQQQKLKKQIQNKKEE
ncbi:hypothetical protein LY90DRAFT_214092 [Neocallimastix californiae]|uniref:Uncharacterized protein n=1 Tax=Neocallimastix californiae TaxID=1754190 RepID=A0A1Y1Z2L2_9FUNG|nr:hypothetical protein LY90DRAFT_214092 [Neocallimastix californiae]|eukprot:ORY04439.1 hypothetical protein LY90DRAFT_214092 [Neocallimastix californiae]